MPGIKSTSGSPFLNEILYLKGLFTFPVIPFTDFFAEEGAIYELPSKTAETFNVPVPAFGLNMIMPSLLVVTLNFFIINSYMNQFFRN